MVANNPEKMNHGKVQYHFNALKKEESGYAPLPDKQVAEKILRETFLRVKREAKAIVADEMDRIMNTPEAEIVK